MPFPRFNVPVDPTCPEVQAEFESMNDPITVSSGVGNEIWAEFKRQHIKKCKRCREYGVANIEVE